MGNDRRPGVGFAVVKPTDILVGRFALLDLAGFTGGDDGVTYRVPRELSPAFRLVDWPVLGVRIDGRIVREQNLAAASIELAPSDLNDNRIGSRLALLDDGRSLGILGREFLIFDTESWTPVGSMPPGVLAGGVHATWTAVRSDGDGGIRLSGRTDDGLVVVTVPKMTSAPRPPAEVPTS